MSTVFSIDDVVAVLRKSPSSISLLKEISAGSVRVTLADLSSAVKQLDQSSFDVEMISFLVQNVELQMQ